MQMVDSIYQQGQIRYSDRTFENINPRYYPPKPPDEKEKDTTDAIEEKETNIEAKERALEHQLFLPRIPLKMMI